MDLDPLITKKELLQLMPYTGLHILRKERAGIFPKRVRIGAQRFAWRRSEVESWLAEPRRILPRFRSTFHLVVAFFRIVVSRRGQP